MCGSTCGRTSSAIASGRTTRRSSRPAARPGTGWRRRPTAWPRSPAASGPERSAIRAVGMSRRPVRAPPERPAGKFKEYELGFVHVDVKHLPKPRTADGELRKRFLFVAIDRRSRSVHLAVEDEETEAAAKAFLEEAVAAFPFRVTHILTDRGSCFTAEGLERRCRELGIEH